MQRWSATVAAVAAVGMGTGALGFAAPARAAEVVDIETKMNGGNDVKGKAGDQTQLGFAVINNSKVVVPAGELTVVIRLPANADLDSADLGGNDCRIADRQATCHPGGDVAAGKAVTGKFKITLKTSGAANGSVTAGTKATDPKPGNNAVTFRIQVAAGAPSASATKSPTAKPSRSQTAAPTDTPADEGTLAPPVAGNGAIPQAEPTPTPTSGGGGGMSLGFWVGIVAIVGALALVGSLFYFRGKDRSEPDTGMHPVVPVPDGYQPGGGYQQPPPSVYGSPQGGYGGSPYGSGDAGPPHGGAPTQVIHPGLAGPPGMPPAGPTQIVPPPGQYGQPGQYGSGPAGTPGAPGPSAPSSDQTVTFRRPEGL